MNRILVIDDDVAVLNYFMILLAQTQRYDLKTLSDSTEAFETIDSGGFDAILLDMDMPVVHGRDVLKYVKERHPEIEVIVVTGVEDVPLAVESMKAGAYDYLCKPIDESRLLLTLERALERSHLRVEISKLREQVSLEGVRHKEAFRAILTQNKSFLESCSASIRSPKAKTTFSSGAKAAPVKNSWPRPSTRSAGGATARSSL